MPDDGNGAEEIVVDGMSIGVVLSYDILYGHDARGNINYKAVWKNNTGNVLEQHYIQQYYYDYDSNNNMTAIKSNNTASATVYASYTYDFFVYAKAHKITNYTYYVFNHLVSTTDETDNKSIYAYYPSNLRFSKQVTDGSNTTYTGFMWDGSQIVLKNQPL